MKLNQAQKQAVLHHGGPLLIVAGAGTGKTTVITERIKTLILDQKINPQQIFATTFTQKAAGEIIARLDTVMPLGYQEPYIGTFHALCDRLLKEEGLEIGLNPHYRIMTATDQWLFLKEHLPKLNLSYYRPLGNPNKFISALIKFFSRLQDENIPPVEFSAYASVNPKATSAEVISQERLQELSRAYQTYTQLKLDFTVMDFGDLLHYTLKLFHERPQILDRLQTYFQAILVDEFQDTNYAQFELIKLLAPPARDPHLTVVADDDQSIYKFRGASIANILEFKQSYPKSTEIILTQNYRSTQAILDAAYRVIVHNNPNRLEAKLGLNKRLTAIKPYNHQTIQALSFPNLDAEINWTVNEIIQLVTRENFHYQDIAILCRANSHLEPYAAVLRSYGLPYQLVSNRGLFDQPEIKDLIHFLETLIDPQNNLSLFAVTQMPLFALSPSLVFDLLAEAKHSGSSLFKMLQANSDPAAQALVSSLTHYQEQAASFSVTKLLYQFVLDTGYIDQFIKIESLDNQLKLKNLNLFFAKLKQFEAVSGNRTAVSFLATLDLWLEAGEDPGQAQIEDVDTISLMTVHSAKGLEFPVVFLGSLVSGRFPSRNKKDPIEVPEKLIKQTIPGGDFNLQEERRLFYVALTRAKTHLYLTNPLDLGGVRKPHPSGFLTETGLPITPWVQTLSLLPPQSPQVTPLVQTITGGQYRITTLSYSKLDTFKMCPLKFKYRYLLQLPARPHHSLSFGRSLHAALQQFHEQEIKGTIPSLETLLSLYQENWVEAGYESETQMRERYDAGVAALKTYYQQFRSLLGKPVMLEQQFKLNLAGVTLVGKIDRIETDTQGNYAIVDYKTGTPKTQKAADTDEQLTVYALAAKEALGIEAKSLSLYFLENGGSKFSTSRTPEKLNKAKLKLISEIETLKASAFPPKPSIHSCQYCEYKKICPYARLK